MFGNIPNSNNNYDETLILDINELPLDNRYGL